MTASGASTHRPGAERARLAALALLAALASTVLVALVREATDATGLVLLLAFLVVPLLLPLPGLLARRRRTYAWATLCVAPHFLFALTEVVANPALRLTAAAILALGLALVVALVAYLRLTPADA